MPTVETDDRTKFDTTPATGRPDTMIAPRGTYVLAGNTLAANTTTLATPALTITNAPTSTYYTAANIT